MNFYDCVRAHENDLNAGEYEILKYVIANRGNLSSMTTKAVAGHFFVAPNTITRMAHKLGFKGFSELKASLLVSMSASELEIEKTSLDEQIVKTKNLISRATIDCIVDAIERAERIVFFCSGLSKYPCLEFSEELEVLGKHVETFSERHVMRHSAERATSGDLVFAVSISGETKVSVDSAAVAKSRGATVVSVTGLSKNSLSKLSNYPVFVIDKQIRYDDMDLSSRLMFHYFFQLLFESYFTHLEAERGAREAVRPRE